MARRDDPSPPPDPDEPVDEAVPEPSPGPASSAEPQPSTPLTQQLGRIAAVALLIAFIVFALDNAQHVDFSWLVGGTEVETVGGERVAGGVRLIVLLLAAFAAGAVIAGTAVAARARTRRKAADRTTERG